MPKVSLMPDNPSDAVEFGLTLARGRIAVGALALMAPRALTRLGRISPGHVAAETVAAARMAAVRDIALGLGAIFAARRSPQALRGWMEAGALADAGDTVLLASTTSFKPSARLVSSVIAGGAAAAGMAAARRITR